MKWIILVFTWIYHNIIENKIRTYTWRGENVLRLVKNYNLNKTLNEPDFGTKIEIKSVSEVWYSWKDFKPRHTELVTAVFSVLTIETRSFAHANNNHYKCKAFINRPIQKIWRQDKSPTIKTTLVQAANSTICVQIIFQNMQITFFFNIQKDPKEQ